MAVSDLRDRVGLAHLAIVDEGRESTSHGQRRSRTGTQDVTGNGQDRFAVSVINAHIGSYLEDIAEVELGGHVDEGVVHRKAGCANDIESTVLARQVDNVPAFSVDGLAITLERPIGEVGSPIDGFVARSTFLIPFGQDKDLEG